MTHPSFFALDAQVLAPQEGEVKAHLATCAQCQAHLAALRVVTPPPPMLEGLHPPRPAAPAWWRFVALGFAAAVLLTLGAFATRPQPQRFTAKGTPTAALWINHGGKVTAWKGQQVHAGDAVRIEVAPAGFTHLTVYDEHTRQVLYEAVVPEGTPTLTPAWEFDGQASSEALRVVLSRAPVSTEVLEAPGCAPSVDSHCTRFTLQLAPSP